MAPAAPRWPFGGCSPAVLAAVQLAVRLAGRLAGQPTVQPANGSSRRDPAAAQVVGHRLVSESAIPRPWDISASPAPSRHSHASLRLRSSITGALRSDFSALAHPALRAVSITERYCWSRWAGGGRWNLTKLILGGGRRFIGRGGVFVEGGGVADSRGFFDGFARVVWSPALAAHHQNQAGVPRVVPCAGHAPSKPGVGACDPPAAVLPTSAKKPPPRGTPREQHVPRAGWKPERGTWSGPSEDVVAPIRGGFQSAVGAGVEQQRVLIAAASDGDYLAQEDGVVSALVYGGQ